MDFNFNARQYVDFCHPHDDLPNDSYFNTNEEVESSKPRRKMWYTPAEVSDEEDFFSPASTTNSEIYYKTKLRKSISMIDLHAPFQNEKSDNELDVKKDQPRSISACSHQSSSQNYINKLAQPKKFTSTDSIQKISEMTMAEAIRKYQTGTPKRFRSKPSPKLKKAVPFAWGSTIPHSPKLKTTARARPTTVISKEEQEKRDIEEARKFKIKAHPLNKNILKGPLKPHVEKKPPTAIEPFHLTEVKKKDQDHVIEEKPLSFKAQPLPKSLHVPFKIKTPEHLATKPQSPNFSKRFTQHTPKKEIEENKRQTSNNVKLTKTMPKPFSFDERDKNFMKRRQEFINKVLEEEKKAREFHAKPPPKAILRSRNNSRDKLSEAGSMKSFKKSTDELDTGLFKAKPATVLHKKPFEPKKDIHVVEIEEFRFSTDERLKARHEFAEKLKEKENEILKHKHEEEELLKRLEEEDIASLRRQMEHKAQPIKKYKEVKIVPSHKFTQPISPKFETDRIRNKENLLH